MTKTRHQAASAVSPVTVVDAASRDLPHLVDRFTRDGALGLVEEILSECGYIRIPGQPMSVKTTGKWRVAVLNHVTDRGAAATYPIVSDVIQTVTPDGVRMRIRPDSRGIAFYVCRLSSDAIKGQADYAALAVELRAAVIRLFGEPSTETVPEVDVEAAVAGVTDLVRLAFTSADRAVWADALGRNAASLGLTADRWQDALAVAEADGRLVWSDGAGYAGGVEVGALDPIPKPPATTQPTPASVVVAADRQPRTPPVPVLVARELTETIGTLEQAKGLYLTLGDKIDDYKQELRHWRQEVARREEALAAARAAADAAETQLRTAETQQAAAYAGVDYEELMRIAALLERLRGSPQGTILPDGGDNAST